MFKFSFALSILLSACSIKTQTQIIGRNFNKTKTICLGIKENQINSVENKYYLESIRKIGSKHGLKIDTKNCDYFTEIDYQIRDSKSIIAHRHPLAFWLPAYFFENKSIFDANYIKEMKINIVDSRNNRIVESISLIDDVTAIKAVRAECLIESIFETIAKSETENFTEIFQESCTANI